MDNVNSFLTEECSACNGTGSLEPPRSRFYSDHKKITCYFCRGKGKLPNKEGKDILELVELYFKGKIR